jgi:hypothetical protein
VSLACCSLFSAWSIGQQRPTFHHCWGKDLPVCTNEQWVRRCWMTGCLGFSSCLWVTQPGLRESQPNVGEASAAGKRGRCADFSGILAAFMRRPEYYTAPLFLTAVMLVAVISLLTLVAACLVGRGSATSAECLGSDQLR